jgi:hypothetical protein
MLMELTSEKRGWCYIIPRFTPFYPYISSYYLSSYLYRLLFLSEYFIIIFSYLCFICLFDLLLYPPVLVVPDLSPCSAWRNPFCTTFSCNVTNES